MERDREVGPREIEEERRSGRDRRDTPTWLTPPFLLQALIQVIAVVAIIINTRSDVASARRDIAELKGQVTTLQTLVQVTTEQKGKIEALNERVAKLENFEQTQTRAYNFNFTTRLANAEAKLGIPSAK